MDRHFDNVINRTRHIRAIAASSVAIAGAFAWLGLAWWYLSIVYRFGWPESITGIAMMAFPALVFLTHCAVFLLRAFRQYSSGYVLALVSLAGAATTIGITYAMHFGGYK